MENNYDIFNYLNKEDNNSFSEMKGYDLLDLIRYLNRYNLEYRNTLNLDESITFGTEIEFEKANLQEIKKQILIEPKLKEFHLVNDSSLIDGNELVSPILHDKKEDWDSLKEACEILDSNAKIYKNAGGHIHIGQQVLGLESYSWINFLKLWQAYENIIFRFAYNEFLQHRSCITTYSEPIRNYLKEILDIYNSYDISCITTRDVLKDVPQHKYCAVNFIHTTIDTPDRRKTIEFRCANGTLDYIIWQNNINLFVKLLLYSRNKDFNNDIIDKRLLTDENTWLGLKYYSEIYLNQALELTDLLFDNNLDKIYFLKQYLKSFETSNKPLQPAKKFTMKK